MAPRVHRYLTFPEYDSGVCVRENDDWIETTAWRDAAGVCRRVDGYGTTRTAIISISIAGIISVAFAIRISAAVVRRARRACRNARRQNRVITK